MAGSAGTIVIFSDLDGTLLDADTYSYDAAAEALEALKGKGALLVLASSKTRAEMEPLRDRLNHRGPFIVENGGALFVPKGFFPFPLPNSVLRGHYQAVEFGTPYGVLRSALKDIARILNRSMRGFGDMSADEIARLTGLSRAEAVLAKQREYDEPFIIDGPAVDFEEVRRQAESRGLRCVRGGRFNHLLGAGDKGRACRYLIECFRRELSSHGGTLETIGIGDSLNDCSMLANVDRPILVQKPDGSYDSEIRVPRLVRAPGIGPIGWNRAVLSLLRAE